MSGDALAEAELLLTESNQRLHELDLLIGERRKDKSNPDRLRLAKAGYSAEKQRNMTLQAEAELLRQPAQPPPAQPPRPAETVTHVDLKTAAELLGISLNTIRRKNKAGEIEGCELRPHLKGERWLVPLATIQAMLQGSETAYPMGNPMSTQVSNQAETELAQLREQVGELKQQLELATLRADSHEQISIERLRVIGYQELAVQLAQRKVLELETATAKRRRWWQKSEPAEPVKSGNTPIDVTS